MLVVASLTAQSGRIIDAIDGGASTALASLLGVNAVVWFACYALMQIGLSDRPGSQTAAPAHAFSRADHVVLSILILACLLPTPFPAAAGLIAGSAWLWWSSAPRSAGRRMAVIGFALTGPVIWGPAFLSLFGPQILWLDAGLGAWLAGYEVNDNMIRTPGDRLDLVVIEGCSAFRNVTQVVLLATTLMVLLNLRLTVSSAAGVIAAILAVILVNGARLAAMALYPVHFDYLHHGGGAILFGYATLVASVIILGLVFAAQARHAR